MTITDEPHEAAWQACALAANHYRNALGWTIVLSDERPTVALSVPHEHAGIDIAAKFTESVNQRLVEAGLAGPMIGCPDGRQVHLVVCDHPAGEPTEPQFDSGVAHLGVGSLVYLPPTRDPDFADTPLVWICGPVADCDLPDCRGLFALVREVIDTERDTRRTTE